MVINKKFISVIFIVFVIIAWSCRNNPVKKCPELISTTLTFGNYYLDSSENNSGKFPGWILKAKISNSTNEVISEEIIKSKFTYCNLISKQDTVKFYLDVIKPIYDLGPGKQREFILSTSRENSAFLKIYEYKNNDSLYYKNIVENWIGKELEINIYINNCTLITTIAKNDIRYKADYYEKIK